MRRIFQNIYSFANTFLLIVCFLTAYLTNSLQADKLILKNGDEFLGIYMSETQEEVEFNVDFTQKKVFAKSEIETIEVETKGIPVTYALTDHPDEEKKAHLYYLDKESAVIVAFGPNKDFERIPAEKIQYLKGEKAQKADQISRIIKPDTRLKLKLKNKKTAWGTIESIDKNQMEIKTVEDSSVSLEENEIQGFVFDKEEPKTKLRDNLYKISYLIPGIYQYGKGSRYDKIKGGTMFGLFLGLVAFLPIQYMEAKKAESNTSDVLIVPIGGSVAILQNQQAYNSARNQFYTGLGVLGALYLYHGYEIYSEVFADGSKAEVSFGYQPNFTSNPFGANYRMAPTIPEAMRVTQETSFFMKFQYSF